MRALVTFSDRHVTSFPPIARAHFEMSYNKFIYVCRPM